MNELHYSKEKRSTHIRKELTNDPAVASSSTFRAPAPSDAATQSTQPTTHAVYFIANRSCNTT